MRKKALQKSNTREILQSKSRFLSILLIILLGVCFYAGIKATGPDMLNTADTYYKDQQLMDAKVVSTLGLEDTDLDLLKQEDYVKQAEGSYSVDLIENKDNGIIRVMSLDVSEKNPINKPVVLEGRLPEKSGEIALDARQEEFSSYKIGDKVTFSNSKDKLKPSEFEVVGFVNSPLFIDRVSRGNTNIGKGAIDAFGIISKEDFDLEVYTEIYLAYQDADKEVSYSKGYKQVIKENKASVKNVLADRPKERLAAIQEEANDKLSEAKEKIADGKKQLQEGFDQIDAAKTQLAEQKANLALAESMRQPVPEEVATQLAEGEAELVKQEKELTQKQTEINESQKEVEEQEKEVAEMEAPEYFVTDRNGNPSYTEFSDNADRISSIATVFPVFFFMIAALICLTTMTRMVDEKRGEIGTLKALGYSNFEIAQKFIIYASIASLVGSGLGLVIGFNVFPTVIFNAYGSMYNLPPVIITYYLSYSLQSVIVAVLCTVLSSLIVLRVDLLSTPSVLMRPKAPKPGKRIILEKIPFIWTRLNFNQKVTARNLFRYKQRMLMTILGIAGCMAMIITGFGVKDSIGDIVNIQFSKIWHYDATVTFDPDATAEETKEYEKTRDSLESYQASLPLAQKTVEVSKKGYKAQEVTIDTPKDTQSFKNFLSLLDYKTGEELPLKETGGLINEKLATLLNIKIGDVIKVKASGDEERDIKVTGIVENYAMHFIYMTPEYYEKVFSEEPEYNVDLIQFKNKLTEVEETTIAESLMDSDKALNVSFTTQISKAMRDTMGSLNVVVWVLIVSAAILAFIVLYNLTNINISERIRELSTIKVLGFYDKEVTMYVYRENNILTVLGILLGCVLGKLLHGFVLQTAEVDLMMFPKNIHGLSYLYSSLLTILFSSVVMLVMHRRLKKVDMIEALKSSE